jgi:hypothetical protein
MWPNVGGDWLIYATLNSSQCHHLDFIEYLADRSRASSIRHAVVQQHSLAFYVEITIWREKD